MIAGRFELRALVAAGGMGTVHQAVDRQSGQSVALKLMGEVGGVEAGERFKREARLLAELDHPTVVRFVDAGVEPDGRLYLAMEWLEGEDLAKRLRRGPLGVAAAVGVARRIAEGLSAAHARGIVHRDVKPHNVFLVDGRLDRLKLVDFGIAFVAGAQSGITRTGMTIGTPEYMAPEQWYGEIERLGPWTDVYSVGLLAYELCTGKLPFEDQEDDPEAARRRRMREPAPPLVPRIPGVPDGFVELVAEMLEQAPTARPQCAADVLAAIADLEVGVPQAPESAPDLEARSARSHAVTLAGPSDGAVSRPIPPPRESRPTAPVRLGRASARFRAGGDAEDAFNAEVAPPMPGAYGLFGLRELPVLGRVDERRALWSAVRTATEKDAPSAVVLSGPAGTGKSRLARDAVERALELGIALELNTHWSAGGSPDEGLRGLVENALGSRGSQGQQFDARLAFFLERFPIESEALRDEAKVLLRPELDAAPDAALPIRVATDVIVRAATYRPVILRLDDVQWSRGEAAALVKSIALARPNLGVCILAAERGDDPDADWSLALNGYSDNVVRLSMEPLGIDATRALVRGLLDLDDELAQIIARRSEGNPLFASQLVGQLVLERAVERRGSKYVLAKSVDVDRVVPPDMGDVWGRNVAVSGAHEDDLVVFALVRERVSNEVVEALAKLVGARFNDSFAHALSAGLIRREGDLYAFSHGLLRDYLLGRIDPKRSAKLHGIAADALQILVGREDVEEARALLLRKARRHREARESLLSAAMWSWRRAERDARQRRLLRLVAWSAAPGSRATHARALAELAQYHAEGGAIESANAAIADSKRVLARSTDLDEHDGAAAWVGFREGQVMRLQGRVEEGAEASARGIEHALRSGESEVHALCLTQLGLDAYRRGDHPTAAKFYDEALALVRESKNRATEAQILMTKSGLEEPKRMEELCRTAVEMAREAGALRIEISARLIWTEALFRCGDRARADAQTAELSTIAQRRGLRQTVSMVEGVAACWAALDSDWEATARHRAVAEKWGASTGAAPERATVAAIDVALALAKSDDVASSAALDVLVREGKTYREPHFVEIVRMLLSTASPHMRAKLQLLDAAVPRE